MTSKPNQLVSIDESDQKTSKQSAQAIKAITKSKKVTKKQAPESNTKKQKRITNYFNANHLLDTAETPLDPEQSKLNELKEQLNKKNEALASIKIQKQMIESKYSKLILQNRIIKQQSRSIIIKTLSQYAQLQRQKRQIIDPKLGYFIKNMQKYVQGQDIIKLQKQLRQHIEQVTRSQEQLRKCKNQEHKDRLKFTIAYINKQIRLKQELMRKKEVQVNVYKIKLKLAEKEKTCTFAQKNWPIIVDSYNKERYLPLFLLGKGGFGQVYKCFDLYTNQYVAVKINMVNLQCEEDKQISNEKNKLKHVQRQISIHKQLNHPNIAQIIEILQISNRKVSFVLQYCDGPQLSLYIKQRKCIEQKDAKIIIYQIFSALVYLSELKQKVIHYDLKPSNIIFHRGIVKLLDFGLCKFMDNQQSRMQLTSQGTGTYWYLPPQTFFNQNIMISPKVDVWSAGIIFYQMLYGKRPFADGCKQSTIFKHKLIIEEAKKQMVFPTETPNRHKVSFEAKKFIQQCLRFNPQDRPSPKQALAHSYFKF